MGDNTLIDPNKPAGVPLKNVIIGAFVIFVVGAAVGRFSLPAKVVTKTETKTVTQVVTQQVVKTVVQHDVQKNDNTVTVKVENDKADGTKTITTTIVDKNTYAAETDKNAQATTATASNTTSDTTTSKTTTYSKNDWMISAMAAPSSISFSNLGGISYGAKVDRRIIGPVYIGVFSLPSTVPIGASIGISF